MNDELKEKAREALGVFIQDALNMREFAIEQTPDVVQQLLMYNFWYYLCWFIVGIVLVVIGITCAIFAMKKMSRHDCEEDIDYINLWAAGILVAMGPCAIGTTMASMSASWIKVWLAPKIWLMEYAAGLIN